MRSAVVFFDNFIIFWHERKCIHEPCFEILSCHVNTDRLHHCSVDHQNLKGPKHTQKNEN